MGRIKHKLIKSKEVICKCGKTHFPKNHAKRYCSNKCRKIFGKNWSKIITEFNKSHPNLCNDCGCDNSGSKFMNCLRCRMKNRIYQKRWQDKKKNVEVKA